MRVIRAESMGFCFGVRDALAAAEALPDPSTTTIHGELVHNERVQQRLRARGFHAVGESARDGRMPTRQVLITAHGVSDRERARLRAAGHDLVDTTCPLVAHAHATARQLAADGYHVVVLGRHGHVEVRGLTGDLPQWTVVADLGDVRTWPHRRLGVLCQTTTPEDLAVELLAAIRAANPHAAVAFRDTVCQPTKQRQRALRRLLPRVDAVVVVGGRGSNNTRQLVRLCEEAGRPCLAVQGPEDIDPARLAGVHTVGLTAGTSTPDDVIDAVERALRAVPVPR